MERRRKPSASITDLARHVALSKGSVSRILNDKGGAFSEETRRRVKAAALEIGYRPSAVAKALSHGRTGIVSLCLSGALTPFLARVSHAYGEELAAHGWDLMVNVYGRHRAGAHPEAITGVADGVVLHDADPLHWPVDAMVAAHRHGELPPVVTSGVFGFRREADHVVVDLEAAAVDAVRHLATGRRRILYLTTGQEGGGGDDGRRAGYLRVTRDAALPPEILDCDTRHRAGIRETLRAYIEARGCPDAFFCHNDDTAVAAFWALADLGRRVPDDVVLVGCDGIDDLDYLPCPIPTIVQPLRALARTAAGFLERRMENPTLPVQSAILQAAFVLPDPERR